MSIACWLTADQANLLAVGSEPAEGLHMTLVCLGDDVDRALVEQILRTVCAETAPLDGEISGFGRFMAAAQDCIYASVDIPELPEFRQRLVDALELVGLDPDDTHGFTPHITLAYVQPGEEDDVEISAPQPILFRSICVSEAGRGHLGEDDIPFGGVAKDDPVGGDVHVDIPSTELSVADVDNPKRKRKVQLVKADDDQRLVYGIVLEPHVEDSQGDICSPEDIEKAAHRFLYANKPIGIQHGAMAPETVRPVESYLAPADFELGGQPVKKGSWVLVAYVPDDKLWEAIKKEGFTGWSIAGTGRRIPVEGGLAPVVEKEDSGMAGALREFAATLGAAIGLIATKEPAAPVVTVNVPKQEPSVVHNDITVQPAAAPIVKNEITLPELKTPDVHVEVAAPQVTVEPVVKVELPPPPAIRIERDNTGRGRRLVPESR